MPRSLSPDAKITLQLDSDAETEQEFYFRSLTMDDERTLGTVYDESVETPNDLRDALTLQLVPYMTGWKLVDTNTVEDGKPKQIPFDPEKLTSIISTVEASELAAKLLASNRMTHEEKKSAESPHSSDAANSANTAPQENAQSDSTASASNAPAATASAADTATTDDSN